MAADPDSDLQGWLIDVIQRTPSGVSEYELLTQLRDDGAFDFQNVSFRDNQSLFNAHFLLFNALYHLRDQLWKDGQACLEISPLKIMLLPYKESASREMAAHDPLGEYYRDLTQLEKTSGAEIDAMLEKFWTRLLGSGQRQQALEIIGLVDPVSDVEIKQQYRRLVMQHHPDRGGEKEKLQDINEALKVLMQSVTN